MLFRTLDRNGKKTLKKSTLIPAISVPVIGIIVGLIIIPIITDESYGCQDGMRKVIETDDLIKCTEFSIFLEPYDARMIRDQVTINDVKINDVDGICVRWEIESSRGSAFDKNQYACRLYLNEGMDLQEQGMPLPAIVIYNASMMYVDIDGQTNEEKDRFFFREPNDFATIMLDAEYIDLRNSTQIDWSNKPSEGFE